MICQRKPSQRVIANLLDRASLHCVLAQAFAVPIAEHIDRINDAMAGLTTFMCSRTSPLAMAFARAAEAWCACDAHNAQREHQRLFTANTPLLRESAHEPTLADLASMYHEFGFALSDSEHAAPDHLCIELDFSSLLLVKAASALAEGEMDHYQRHCEAFAAFLQHHLGRWVPALTNCLELAHATAPYAETIVLLDYAISDECQLLGINPQPLHHPARFEIQPENIHPVTPRMPIH